MLLPLQPIMHLLLLIMLPHQLTMHLPQLTMLLRQLIMLLPLHIMPLTLPSMVFFLLFQDSFVFSSK